MTYFVSTYLSDHSHDLSLPLKCPEHSLSLPNISMAPTSLQRLLICFLPASSCQKTPPFEMESEDSTNHSFPSPLLSV